MSVIEALKRYALPNHGERPWEYSIDEPTKLLHFIEEMLHNGLQEYIWRGQSDASWGLKTSLQRYYESQGLTVRDEQIVNERSALKAFRQIVSGLPEYETYVRSKRSAGMEVTDSELLVMMRHYDCPTRLLDWTRSPYVGLYFAAAHMHENGAIFGLNLTAYHKEANHLYQKLVKELHPTSNLPSVFKDVEFREILEKPVPHPALLHSTITIGRVFSQQSIFLVDLDLSPHLTDEAIWTVLGNKAESCFFKLVFPRASFRAHLDKELYSMNIDGYHLFEGLTGASYYALPFLTGLKPFGSSLG